MCVSKKERGQEKGIVNSYGSITICLGVFVVPQVLSILEFMTWRGVYCMAKTTYVIG
jgi:hypothetical protein